MQTSISTTTIEDHLHHYSPEESQKLLSRESSINTDLFKHENGMYIFWNVCKSS
ncbi:bud site selection protein BUD4 [Candida albicans Ca529L]|nr:bud site selection protein BUD4 [Candida albicans Ca529L]